MGVQEQNGRSSEVDADYTDMLGTQSNGISSAEEHFENPKKRQPEEEGRDSNVGDVKRARMASTSNPEDPCESEKEETAQVSDPFLSVEAKPNVSKENMNVSSTVLSIDKEKEEPDKQNSTLTIDYDDGAKQRANHSVTPPRDFR